DRTFRRSTPRPFVIHQLADRRPEGAAGQALPGLRQGQSDALDRRTRPASRCLRGLRARVAPGDSTRPNATHARIPRARVVMRVEKFPIVFNSDSLDLGFIEQIAPEAVDRTMRDRSAEVVALYSHDANKPLGRRSAGTLTLEKRASGLLASVDVSETVSYASDLIEIIKRGDAPG